MLTSAHSIASIRCRVNLEIYDTPDCMQTSLVILVIRISFRQLIDGRVYLIKLTKGFILLLRCMAFLLLISSGSIRLDRFYHDITGGVFQACKFDHSNIVSGGFQLETT